MPLPDAVVGLTSARAGLTVATVAAARRTVDRMPPSRAAWARAWPSSLARLLVLTTAAQRAAVAQTDGVVTEALAQQGHPGMVTAGRVDPAALSGVASDGRSLLGLLDRAGVVTLRAWGSDDSAAAARLAGRALLTTLVDTQLADAGRAGVGVQLAATDGAGYVRVAVGTACARCAVLTGSFYRFSAGFLRHPRCHCVHVPAVRGETPAGVGSPRGHWEGLTAAEQDRVYTRAGARAIRDGADLAQVVNARRGRTMRVAGRPPTTTEGTTRRGTFGRRWRREHDGSPPMVRLMPEGIYQLAGGDRVEAVRLLRAYGYLRDPVQV